MTGVRAWIGIVVFVAGALLWRRARMLKDGAPPWFARLGMGVTSLGLATMTATLPGLPWSIASIGLSVISIACLAAVIRASTRRN